MSLADIKKKKEKEAGGLWKLLAVKEQHYNNSLCIIVAEFPRENNPIVLLGHVQEFLVSNLPPHQITIGKLHIKSTEFNIQDACIHAWEVDIQKWVNTFFDRGTAYNVVLRCNEWYMVCTI